MQGWTRIANAVNADAVVANRVIYDVLNEPDAFGVRFESQNGRPGMKDLYFSAFDAIYAVNPGSCISKMPCMKQEMLCSCVGTYRVKLQQPALRSLKDKVLQDSSSPCATMNQVWQMHARLPVCPLAGVARGVNTSTNFAIL